MELGSSVYTYLWDCSLEQAIARAAGHGFRLLEVPTTPPFLWPAHFGPFERRRLRRQLQALGLAIYSVNPTFLDINLVSLNPAVRAASIAEIEDNIRLAADLEVPVVVVSAGRRHPLIPSPFEDAFGLAVETIGRLARLGEQLGVVLGLENVPALFIERADQLVRLVSAVGSPHCRIVYDVANALLVEDPAAGLEAVADHLVLVHLCDTPKDRWAHLPVGLGQVDFPAVARTLAGINYDGVLMLETTYAEDPDGGIRASLSALDSLGLFKGPGRRSSD